MSSNLEASAEEALALRGDIIGNTAYSERWVLKVMMRLNRFAVEQDDFDSSFEKELCVLWDMTVEDDIALFLSEHGIATIAVTLLWKYETPRFREIIVGILGNICHLQQVRKKLMQLTDLREVLMDSVLSDHDTQTLVQLMRVLNCFAFEIRDIMGGYKLSNLCWNQDYRKGITTKMKESSHSNDVVRSQDWRNYPETVSDSSDIEILSTHGNESDISIVKEIEKGGHNKASDRNPEKGTRVYESVSEDDDIQILECLNVTSNKSCSEEYEKSDDAKLITSDEVVKKYRTGSNNVDPMYGYCIYKRKVSPTTISNTILNQTNSSALEENKTVDSLPCSASNVCVESELVNDAKTIMSDEVVEEYRAGSSNDDDHDDPMNEHSISRKRKASPISFSDIIFEQTNSSTLEESKTVDSIPCTASNVSVKSESVNDGNTISDNAILNGHDDESPEQMNSISKSFPKEDTIIQDGGCLDSDNENSEPECVCLKVITKEDRIVDGGVLSSDDEKPEIIAVVKGKPGFERLWYEQFLKVSEWTPPICHILQNNLNAELIKHVWSFLATLSFIKTENTLLGCIMAGPDLLKTLFTSFYEYFGFHSILDPLKPKDVNGCHSRLIDITVILYSFMFSKTSLNYCCPLKLEIMTVIFKIFEYYTTYGPMDAITFECIVQGCEILDSYMTYESSEVPILQLGIKNVLNLSTLLAGEIENEAYLEGGLEQDAKNATESFLRRVLQWLDDENIGELVPVHEELKIKFNDCF